MTVATGASRVVENPNVYIEGVALEFSWADQKRNLMELIYDTVSRAVEDAGQGYDGIDSVVLAAHDLVDGRSLTNMVTAPAAGAYLRDEVRYSDDGAGAFAAAVARIEACESQRTIVAAWGRTSEHDVEAFSRSLFDRIFLAPLGLEELHVAAINAQKWRIAGGDATAVEAAQSRRAAQARQNPRALQSGGRRSVPAYPFDADHLPLWGDVVAAMVISGKPATVKVSGLGLSSDPYWPGDRLVAEAPALRRASERALADAGLSVGDISLFEIDGMTLYDEAIALEAIGLAPKGQGMRMLAEDARCNPSGGSAAGYAVPAMGLVRIVEAALQLRGSAGPIQLARPRTALASGLSVTAAQAHIAIVLEAA
jgi:acetyl-CoA C-acetyltransferase